MNNLNINEELLFQFLGLNESNVSNELLEILNSGNNVRTLQFSFPSYWSQNRRVRSVQDVLEESMNVRPVFKYVISEEGKALLKEESYDPSNNQQLESKLCPISLVEFEKDEKLIRLPCNHLFNKENIMNWLEKEKSECPVCRYQLPSNEIRNNDVDNETNSNRTTSSENENNDLSSNSMNNMNNSFYNNEDSDEDDDLEDFIDTYEQRRTLITRLSALDNLLNRRYGFGYDF